MDINKNKPVELGTALAKTMMQLNPVGSLGWHYETGLFLLSLWKLADFQQDTGCRDYIKAQADSLVDPSGSIHGYKDDEFNLDQINAGKILLELFRIHDDPRYGTACATLRKQLAEHPRTRSGSYWHKKIYPYQVWLDGLYMFAPFAVRWALIHNEHDFLDDVCEQFVLAEEKTRDPASGLLLHAWDESRKQLWADPVHGRAPHAWGRAMGWYSMALCDVLELLPVHHSKRESLTAICERVVHSILSCRDTESGLWFQILDQAGRPGNYPETSASAMFIYALRKASRLGICGDGDSCAREAFADLSRRYLTLHPDGSASLAGICKVAGLGGNPYRDGSFSYYVHEPVVADDFKGVGPYILASVELSRDS